jgi:predicted ATPase
MAALKRIQIKGFKSIRELDLELHNLNVLIGANGSGKSNFLSVFKLFQQIARRNLQIHVSKSGGANSFLYLGGKIAQVMEFEFELEEIIYSANLGRTQNDSFMFANEWYKQDNSRYMVSPSRLHEESGLHHLARGRGKQSEAAEQILQCFEQWRIYHLNDTTDTAKIKFTGDLGDNIFLREDGSNLAAFLYIIHLKQRPYYDRIIETIRLAAPFFDDFDLRPDRLNEDKIRLEWREKGSDFYFNASALSDGTLRFMCLTTLLMQPTLPPIILIDEPELGLHPYAITLLADMLISAATKTQIIVSTQSAALVNHFEPEDIVVVDKDKGESVFHRLNPQSLEAWLENYTLAELWQKNVIGGRP